MDSISFFIEIAALVFQVMAYRRVAKANA